MKRPAVALCFIILHCALCMAQTDGTSLYEQGIAAEESGQAAQALQLFKDASQWYTAHGQEQTEDNANCLHHQGRCYYDLKQYQADYNATLQAATIRKALLGEVSEPYINSFNNMALARFELGQKEESIRMWEQVDSLCQQLKHEHPNRQMYRMNLARAYLAAGREALGKPILDNIISHTAQAHGTTSETYGNLMKQLGALYCTIDQYAVGASYYEQSLACMNDTTEAYAKIAEHLAFIYAELGNAAKEIEYMQIVEAHNQRELQKPCNEPSCMLDRAQYLSATEKKAEAKECFLKAINLCQSADKAMLGQVYEAYAHFLSQLNDNDGAAEYMELAAQTQEQVNGITRHVGELYWYASHLSFSSELSLRPLNFTRTIINSRKAANYYATQADSVSRDRHNDCLLRIGRCYYFLEQYDEARSYYDQVLQSFPADAIAKQRGKAIEDIADIEVKQQQFAKAEQHFRQSIAIYQALSEQSAYSSALSSLYRCIQKSGDNERTEQLQAEINAMHLAQQQRLLAEMEAMLPVEASMYGKESLAYTQELGNVAELYFDMGNYQKSTKLYHEYVDCNRPALRNMFRLLNQTDRSALWNEMKTTYDMLMCHTIHPDITANAELRNEYAQMGYDVLLLTKGILLNSAIEFDKVLADAADPAVKATYERIISRTEQLLALQASGDASQQEQMRQLRQQIDADQLQLMKGCAEYADYTSYMGYTWRDVQACLKEGDAAIEFAAINTSMLSSTNPIYAFIIDRNSSVPVIVKIDNDLSIETMGKSILAMDSTYADNEPYQFDIARVMLGERVWKPLMPYLQGKRRVFFSPDGALCQQPIEYLPWKISLTDSTIADEFDIYRLSSTKELCMHHDRLFLPLNAALYGGIDYGDTQDYAGELRYMATRGAIEGFTPLNGTQREVEQISDIMRQSLPKKSRVTLTTGTEASKLHFLNQPTDINLLHIATHGAYSDQGWRTTEADGMQRSLLAFSGINLELDDPENDGRVTAEDVSHMNLRHCQLVVMSACETGLGHLGGDGVFGLQRGFKNAGARTLLMSLRKVDDEATQLLMTEFYRLLLDKKHPMSRRQALATAQRRLRTLQKGRFNHPRYWSSFIMLDGLE